MLHGNSTIKGSLIHLSNTATYVAFGNTAQRTTATAGAIRYNSQTGKVEAASDPTLSGSLTWNNVTNDLTSIGTSGAGISASTTNGVTTISLSGEALGQAGLGTSGLVTRTAANTYTARTISAGTGITITNGDGVSGNPTVAAKTTNVTTGIVSSNVAVISTSLSGQTLLSSGTAGSEATWGALNLASANAVTGILPVSAGGTGGSNASTARVALGLNGIYRGTATGGNTTSIAHNLGQQYTVVYVIDTTTNSLVFADNVFYVNSTTVNVELTSYNLGTVFSILVMG